MRDKPRPAALARSAREHICCSALPAAHRTPSSTQPPPGCSGGAAACTCTKSGSGRKHSYSANAAAINPKRKVNDSGPCRWQPAVPINLLWNLALGAPKHTVAHVRNVTLQGLPRHALRPATLASSTRALAPEFGEQMLHPSREFFCPAEHPNSRPPLLNGPSSSVAHGTHHPVQMWKSMCHPVLLVP